MTPDEQQMISALFERIGKVGRVDKDYDAEKLIKDEVRRLPDASYVLVQSVLVQEEALSQADARIRDLEDQLAQLQPPERPRASGGSFLGRGGGSVAPAPAMRPQSGSQSPWAPRPGDQAPPQQQPQRGGGGFLSSALSTAAGVTGGMLAAESLRGLFGGGGGLFGGQAHANDGALQSAEDRAQDAEQDLSEAQSDLAADDAALDEQQDNDEQTSSDDQGGGDDGGIDV